jgi:hypothetical protein
MKWFLFLVGIAIVWNSWVKSRPKSTHNVFTKNCGGPDNFKPTRQELMGNIQGPGHFEFDVVGESHYQEALESIAGAKDDESKRHDCVAELVLEDDNPHDNQAILVAIDGKQVGYLSRKHAREFRAELRQQGISVTVCRVPALIVGGWKRGLDEGHFGVKLDLPMVE